MNDIVVILSIFQFLKGTIKSKLVDDDSSMLLTFQFLKGTIKRILHEIDRRINLYFNS